MKITVVGKSYIGLSNVVLLAQNNEVVALDLVKEKVRWLNQKNSPSEEVYNILDDNYTTIIIY